jgi:hypothetical protein
MTRTPTKQEARRSALSSSRPAVAAKHGAWTTVAAKRTNAASSGKQTDARGPSALGPNKHKGDKGKLRRLIYGPASELYFQIRAKCNKDSDDVEALKKLLPARKHLGKDFAVWPKERLLLHGLVKHNCTACVKYLVETLKFNVNLPRADGCTPLHMAHYCLQGKSRVRMTQLLMMLKADPSATNKWGEKPADLGAKSPDKGARAPSPCGVADLDPAAVEFAAPKSLNVQAASFVPIAVQQEMSKTGMIYEEGRFVWYSARCQ